MAADSKFDFKVDGLKVTLTFGVHTGSKKFKNTAELTAAQKVYDDTMKAMKGKKNTGSLKAELFSIFGIDFNAVPKSDAKPSKPQSENKESKATTKQPDKAAKPASPTKDKPAKEEAPKLKKTTFVQVGKNIVIVMDSETLSKKIEDNAVVKGLIKLYDKIKGIEASDKMSTMQLTSLAKLKQGVKDIMQSNTIKAEKEKAAVDTKVKAIDKQMNKLKKEPTVKVVTPNKSIADLLKENGHELDNTQVEQIKNIIEKKKTEAPKAVVAPTGRRGEY